MLETLRKGASTWLARALLALVAVSFIIWGANNKSGRTDVRALATVGGSEITLTDYQRAFDTELNALSQRAKRRITTEEARAYGLDRQVLSKLVGFASLDAHAKSLGLELSDETLAENLQRDPNFKGFDGKFDKSGFDQMLKNMGLTERGFLALKRKEDVRDQLTGTLVNAIVTPKPVLLAAHAWREESRTIEHVTINGDKAVTIPDPDATKLKETYEANKPKFMAPEYRKLQILLLSVDELKKDVTTTDAEIAASYEQTKDTYATPELRRVLQIAFKSKADAEAAKAAIAGGKNFMTVAQEAGAKPSDVRYSTPRSVTRPSLSRRTRFQTSSRASLPPSSFASPRSKQENNPASTRLRTA
jgi:peptidyl-prolyl cis-trans isomerase D